MLFQLPTPPREVRIRKAGTGIAIAASYVSGTNLAGIYGRQGFVEIETLLSSCRACRGEQQPWLATVGGAP